MEGSFVGTSGGSGPGLHSLGVGVCGCPWWQEDGWAGTEVPEQWTKAVRVAPTLSTQALQAPANLFGGADDITGAPGSHQPPRATDGAIYMEEAQPCHPSASPAPLLLLLPILGAEQMEDAGTPPQRPRLSAHTSAS